MPWMRLSGSVPGHAAAELGERLLALGAVAVSWSDDGDAPIIEPKPGVPPDLAAWPVARVEGLLPLEAELAGAREAFAACSIQVDFVADRDWSETWRRFAPTRQFGRNATANSSIVMSRRFAPTRQFGPLAVAPLDAPAPAAPVVLRLDPGMAFGTGAHPTTQLCLDWLAARPLAGKTVLDYGCGSGILAIAAGLLGARRVVAVDEDPQALTATDQNARRNGVSVEAVHADAYRAAPFDVVVANILSETLVALAARLTGSVASRGELALSGILAHQSERVAAAYAAQGLVVSALAESDGWALLHGVSA